MKHAIGTGVRLGWVTFGEDYGQIPEFWFELGGLGLRGMGEIRKSFFCWPTRPKYRSGHSAHASKQVENVCRYSPNFATKKWKRIKIKAATRGPVIWEVIACSPRGSGTQPESLTVGTPPRVNGVLVLQFKACTLQQLKVTLI